MKKSLIATIAILFFGNNIIAQINSANTQQLSGTWTINHLPVSGERSNYTPAIMNKMLTEIQFYSVNNALSASAINTYSDSPVIEKSNDSILIYYYVLKNSVDSFFINIDLKKSSSDILLGELVSMNGRLNITLTKKK